MIYKKNGTNIGRSNMSVNKYKPAMDSVKNIVMTEKLEMILQDEAQVLTMYGATGNGKSMGSTWKFMAKVFNAERHQQTFLLAGKDIATLERRFIEHNGSVLNWWPFKGKWEYKKIDKGGSRIIVKTRTGKKYIYLTPFSNVNAYARVLGNTINGTFIDEAVEADELFLQEIVARTNRTQGTFLIMTSNGGDPNHFFYTGIVNKSTPKMDVPQEELSYFEPEEKRNPRWSFYHLKLEDNPTYSEEQLRNYYTLYPVGSFMYFSRIMGIRGFSMSSPFSAYINNAWVNEQDVVHTQPFNNIVFSVDSGGHVFSNKRMNDSEYKDGDYGTQDGGHTLMLYGGFSRDYRKFFLLGGYFPNHMEQHQNVLRINRHVVEVAERYRWANRPYMFVDNADSNMLVTCRNHVRNIGEIRPAVKRDSSIALDEPVTISLIQQYMIRGDFHIVDNEFNRRWLVPALINAKQESDGKLFDNASWEADVQDTLKYIFSSMYRPIVNTLSRF